MFSLLLYKPTARNKYRPSREVCIVYYVDLWTNYLKYCVGDRVFKPFTGLHHPSLTLDYVGGSECVSSALPANRAQERISPSCEGRIIDYIDLWAN
jgi:hypothetical protein